MYSFHFPYDGFIDGRPYILLEVKYIKNIIEQVNEFDIFDIDAFFLNIVFR